MNLFNPSVSVWFKVSYESKDKFKKYRAKWNPSSTDIRFMKSWCMKITEEDNMGEWKKTHEMILRLNTELKNHSGGYLIAIEDSIGLLDKYDTFIMIFGKPREKSKWEMEQETTENLSVPSKCLIVDDDELNVPVVSVAVRPIDEYMRGKKERIRYIKSEKVFGSSHICRWRCMESQLNMRCECECKYDHYRILLEIAEENIAPYDDKQKVGFGKFRDWIWWDMMRTPETKSWSDWYIKNCRNQGDFYKYLVLAKEISVLKDDIRYITNPNHD